jgi:glutaconyl-CoA/methylmalonyl-CoA decarboxylase subunit gamma
MAEMLRAFRITVNGNAYDVMVEEVGSGSVPSSMPIFPPAARPPATPPVQAVAPNGPSTVSALTAAPTCQDEDLFSKPLGSGTVKAPIPGTISAVRVSQGQTVARGDVILILDAMKMENEVCSEADGTVTRIFVEAGAMVNTGDPLMEIS